MPPCLFAEWLSAFGGLSSGEPGPLDGDSTTAPGAPLKLLSMLCDPGTFEFHTLAYPWQSPMLAPKRKSAPLSTALGLEFQVVPSLAYLASSVLASTPLELLSLLLPNTVV